MASLYKRGALWWIEYKDLTGKRRQASTGLRWSVVGMTRKAQELRRAMTEKESQSVAEAETWGAWVSRFLDDRYANAPSTLARYRNSWRNISAFLDAHAIHVPRQLSRQHVRDYIHWRQKPHEDRGCLAVGRNTALHELKLLRILMREAVQSGYAQVNPCERLGVPNTPAKRKPRITDAEHKQILAALADCPSWMHIAYSIAWEQGCRFSETCLPLSDIDLDRMVIRFRTKGHKANVAEFPLSPNLVPLIHKLKSSGRATTFDLPAFASTAWVRFFKRIGLPHLCFHCTRVTFITRCYEAGIARDSVMRLVGHATVAAHEVYPRLVADHQTAQAMRSLL